MSLSVTAGVFYSLVAILTALIIYLKKRLSYWQSRGIACEAPNLLLGNITGIEISRCFSDIWLSHYEKFKGTGPFSGFYWFQRPAVFVLDPALIKNVLIKDFSKFTDRGFFHNEQDDPMTGQLFLLDGLKWKNMRSKLSPTFTSGKMKFMFPTIIKVSEEFVEVFAEMIKKSNTIEVRELLARFTTDVIGTCAFGIDCSSLKDPQAEFLIMGRKALNEQRYGRLGIAFLSSFPHLARKLHMKQTPDYIEEFFMRIVRETVTLREQKNIRRNDFMDQLIDLKNNGEVMKNLTIEEMTAQAFIFFAAGFETSSTTMAFALYELAQHEDIQERAREEINTILEEHNNQFTYESMKKMKYLNQIISETLRLYTVLPVLNREALEDYVVPGHPKYVIKKGMPVLIPIGAIHRDPNYYPNPEVFNPDNFTDELVNERDSVLYLPFGDGPRNCVGMRFGLMQTRIGLAVLLKNFKFSVGERTQIPLEYDKKSYLVSTTKGIYLQCENI